MNSFYENANYILLFLLFSSTYVILKLQTIISMLIYFFLHFLHERAFVINLKLFETNIIHSPFSVLKINCLIDQFCDFFLFSLTAISLIHVI